MSNDIFLSRWLLPKIVGNDNEEFFNDGHYQRQQEIGTQSRFRLLILIILIFQDQISSFYMVLGPVKFQREIQFDQDSTEHAGFERATNPTLNNKTTSHID